LVRNSEKRLEKLERRRRRATLAPMRNSTAPKIRPPAAGNIVWRVRCGVGISQKQLAAMLNVHPVTLCKWERGGAEPGAWHRAVLEFAFAAGRRLLRRVKPTLPPGRFRRRWRFRLFCRRRHRIPRQTLQRRARPQSRRLRVNAGEISVG
jgi:DNA-binding transcriptional regulator YiaG